jgi:plastocyanin
MTYRPLAARLAQAAVLTTLLLVALPAAAAQAVVPTKQVAIVLPSATCKSQIACYQPGTFKVLRGTRIIWTNKTSFAHTVTRCTVAACGVSGGTGKNAAPNSPILNAGAKYAFTFTSPGSYVYYCKIHGYRFMHASFTIT